MMTSSPRDEELLAGFREALERASPEELHHLLHGLLDTAPAPRRPSRPELRRPRPAEPQLLTVRVDLQRAKPPIWRRLDLSGDLTLAQLHRILQLSYDWLDYHLFRFALGGSPFDRDAQLFLCPYDVEEGEDEGTPVEDVHLDEALQEVGDVLRYSYDYGDGWELRITVEEVRPAPEDAPPARVRGGRRAAPPEDCGGLTTAAELATVLPDAAAFDPDELQQALDDEAAGRDVQDARMHPALADLLDRCGSAGAGLGRRALVVMFPPEPPEPGELERDLHAVTWFLDRAADGGIPLTAAGYLRPADVQEASRVVPAMDRRLGKNNRENRAVPLLRFREALQSFRVLRKYKGSLLPTRGAAAARTDLSHMWEWLLSSAIPAPGSFEHDATLVLLLHVADSRPEEGTSLAEVAADVTDIGWSVDDGRPVPEILIRELPVASLLANISPPERDLLGPTHYGQTAVTFARAVLSLPLEDD